MVGNRLDIPALIQYPNRIGEEEILLLTDELKNKPWCATYQVLLSKGYANIDSYLQGKHLRLASTYIGDRVVLFDMMHQLKEEADNQKETAIDPKVSEEEVATSLNETSIESDTEVVAEHKVAADVQEEIETAATVEEAKIESKEESIAEDVVSPEEVNAQDTNLEESVSIDEQEGLSPATSPIDFDKLIKYDPIKELEALKVVKTPPKESLSYDTVIYNTEEELTKLIEQREDAEEKGEQDFASWLNNIGEDKKEATPARKSPDKVQQLLDQFLATKRKRPIQSRAFYNAQNKAEESEVDSMNVVSETLLELYVKQGHYLKAIKGYQKLSLQNPDKSAYFAARITELEELQKEQ